MKIIRAAVLAIIVSLALLGSTTTVANAELGAALVTHGAAAATADPGDPGFPPGD